MDAVTFVFMGFEVTLISIDALNRTFLLAFAVAGLGALTYAHAMTKDIRHTLLSAAFIAVSAGTVAAGDFFSFLVFWELMMVISCILLVYDGRVKSVEAGFRYLLLHVFAGVSLLFAVIIQYVVTGQMVFAAPVVAALPFFIVACAVKGTMLPFYVWVPDAYSNTMPASAVVLSAFTTKVGVYSVARILGGTIPIAYMGGAMAVFGVIMALGQKNLRRLLSFHMVSQVGYMMAGVALGTAAGTDAGTLHLFNNVMYKTLLFMVAGAVWYRTRAEDTKSLGGLARSMPITFVCGIVGALSISGMPPFNGFVSKTMLDYAVGDHTALKVLLFIAGVGTTMSFAKFIWYTFLNKGEAKAPPVREVPVSLQVPMVYLALLCLVSGIAYGTVATMLPSSTWMAVYEPMKILKSIAVVVGGVGFFFGIRGLIDSFGYWTVLQPKDLISRAVDRVATLSGSFLYRQGEDIHLLVVAFALVGMIMLFW